jgi:hypothetical protein
MSISCNLFYFFQVEHPDVDSPMALQTPRSPRSRSPLMTSSLALPAPAPPAIVSVGHTSSPPPLLPPPSSPPFPSVPLSPALMSPVPAPPSLSLKCVQVSFLEHKMLRLKLALTFTQSLKLDELKELIKVWCIQVSVAKPKKEGKTLNTHSLHVTNSVLRLCSSCLTCTK